MPQSQANETVTLRLPSGEEVDAVVPSGMSDQQVHDLMQQKHPEYFQQSSQSQPPTDISGKPRSAISRFWEGAKAGMGGENALNTKIDPNHPIASNPMIPGAGVYRDIKGGNYAGAIGRIAAPVAAIGASIMGGGRGIEAPSPAPRLLDEAIAADAIPRTPFPDRVGAHLDNAMKPNIAGNATLDLVPRYPGAPLPEKPAIELMQARPLAIGGKRPPLAASSALGKIANHPEAPGVYPGAHLPEKPAIELMQSRGLANGAQVTPEPQSSALGKIPVRAQETPAIAKPPAPKEIERQLNDALGGKPLISNVPLKQQGSRITGTPSQGMTPVESSAIKSYKYDPERREFEVITNNGSHVIHGDVSPEDAKAFEGASSKGKAWGELKKNSTYVGKVVNGQRIYAQPPKNLRSADPNDLTDILQRSLEQVKKKPTIQ